MGCSWLEAVCIHFPCVQVVPFRGFLCSIFSSRRISTFLLSPAFGFSYFLHMRIGEKRGKLRVRTQSLCTVHVDDMHSRHGSFVTRLLLGSSFNAGMDDPAQALERFDGVYDNARVDDEVDEL